MSNKETNTDGKGKGKGKGNDDASGATDSTTTQITFYISVILRGRIEQKIDEVMNRTFCNLIKGLFVIEENGIQTGLEEKAINLLKKMKFVGDDLETSISLLNPKYTRNRVRRKCKNSLANNMIFGTLMNVASSVGNFTRRKRDELNERIDRKMEEQQEARSNRRGLHNFQKYGEFGAPLKGNRINYNKAATLKNAKGKHEKLRQTKRNKHENRKTVEENRRKSLQKNLEGGEKRGGVNEPDMSKGMPGMSGMSGMPGMSGIPGMPGLPSMPKSSDFEEYSNRISGETAPPSTDDFSDAMDGLGEKFKQDIQELIEVFTTVLDDLDTRMAIKESIDNPKVVKHINHTISTYLIDLLDPVTMRDLLLEQLEKATKTIIVKESTENGKVNVVKRKAYEDVLMKKHLLKNCQKIGMRRQYNEKSPKDTKLDGLQL